MAPSPAVSRGLGDLLAGSLARLRGSPALRRSLLCWLLLGVVIAVAGAAGVAALHGGDYPLALLVGLGWWLLVSLVVIGGLDLLVTPDGVAVDRLGVPNGLSAVRTWFCWPLLLAASVSLPGRLGIILWGAVGGPAGLLDMVDGYLARRVGPVTQLGKAIDPAGDAMFFAVGAAGCCELGIMPLWLAGLIVFRYIGPLLATPAVLLVLRRRPEVVRTEWGRWSTVATGLVFFVLLLVRLFNGPVDGVALVLGLVLLVPTTILHFGSLANRLRKAPSAA